MITYWTQVRKWPLLQSHMTGKLACHLSLILVGTFVFCSNHHLSLFQGSEGLYAQISREMVQSREFFQLTYQGDPYANKPPLFFWTLALSTGLLGEHEIALRLPGALFNLGTMALAYFLGKSLFSRTAGFLSLIHI